MKQICLLFTLGIGLLLFSSSSFSQVSIGVTISAGFAPPELPVYEQPPCPVEGYLWTPGYWAFADGDYYWVPGVWVDPPVVGYLWTPAYWLFVDGNYRWNRGYWGRHVGFYGGINYGFGYFGSGFYGGRWEGRHFRYNRSASNISNHFHHSYEDRSVVHENNRRTSYNGGAGGIDRHADKHEEAAFMEQHHASTPEQRSHVKAARSDRGQFMKENHGQPAHVAVKTTNDYRGNLPKQNNNPGRPQPAQPNNPIRPQGNNNPAQPQQHQPVRPQQQPMNHPQVSPPKQQPAPQNHPMPVNPKQEQPLQHQPVRPQPTPQNHPVSVPPKQQPQQPAPQQHQPVRPQQTPQNHPMPVPQRQEPNRPQGNGNPAQGGRPGQINPGQGRKE